MKKVIAFIFFAYIVIYILPLNVRPMIIPDETRYAEIAREMIETGNWISPRLDGLRYFEKPILGLWLNAISIKLFGENAFAIRLPSALAVGLSAIILFFLILRITNESKRAVIASCVFLSCFEIYIIGTFSVLDSVFSMFITAIMLFLFMQKY